VLYAFGTGAGGSGPFGGVIGDGAGGLCGLAGGGTADDGVLYDLDTASHETVLYTFGGGAGGGAPVGVVRDAAGNFYGATRYGGAHDSGVVFRLAAQ
jgi:uncharacterized repeat protein (TIGR03803 family)